MLFFFRLGERRGRGKQSTTFVRRETLVLKQRARVVVMGGINDAADGGVDCNAFHV